MSKTLKYKKSKDRIEVVKSFEIIDFNDSLGNLLLSSEKLKSSLHHLKLKSPILSLTASVISCVNNVLSEYGEEALKRQRYNKNGVSESKPKEGIDKKWTNCVKVLEELVTSDKVLDNELIELILILIAQVHERQSLRIVDTQVLHSVIVKWVAHMEHVDCRLTHLYTRCLAGFILGNLADIPKEIFSSLSGAFFRQSERLLAIECPDCESLDVLKYCVSGLTNLCYLAPSSDGSEMDDFLAKRFQTCGRFFQLFVLCLERLPEFEELPQVSRFRMQHQCLHGLNYVSQRPHGLSLDNTERLLKVLQVYCGFGMFRRSCLDTSVTLTTDNGDCTTCGDYKRTAPPPPESGEQYESEEFASHAQQQQQYRPMRKWEVKTRRLSLELLLKVLAKSWRKVAAAVWAHFMPATAWATRARFHLLNVLEREKDDGLKVLVLKAIEQCVINCRDMLASAQHQPAPSTFVSHSHNLASVIDELHQRILAILVADRSIEKSTEVRVETLRCLLALIRSVPYHRLRSTIVHSVVRGLRQVFLESHHSQTVLRCVVLDCFTSLVSFESVSVEMRHLLLRPTMHSLFFGESRGESHGCSQPSWLVQLCVRLAHPSLVAQLWTSPLSSESWDGDMDPVVAKVVKEGALETDADVRCQALITVGAMLSQHGSLIRPSLDTLKRTLLACLQESLLPDSANAILRSHVLRVFSGFLTTLENKKAKRYLGIVQDSQNTVNDCPEIQLYSYSLTEDNVELSLEWWSSFLEFVVLCLQDKDDGVRASAGQCMSLMSEYVLENLVKADDRRQYYLLLLSMFKDPSLAVCCQAVWALGYWVAMRPLNIDLVFIKELIVACYKLAEAAVEDPTVYVVCANATWSLSNAVEVLVAHKEGLLSCCKGDGVDKCCRELVEHYISDPESIYQLLKLFCDLCSLKKAGQVAASARIHENAIRGLGYLCRFIDDTLCSQEHISQQLLIASDVFCKAIQLPDKAGRVKVKWNACLSASHVCRNPTLTRNLTTFALESLIDTLIGTVATDRYFKVRNNSLISLLTLVDTNGRPPLGSHILQRIVRPLSEACISVTLKSTVPFSEVHRHCLCLYLLKYLLLKVLCVLSHDDLLELSTDESLLSLLSTTFTEHLPQIWQQLHHLNRSFNKRTLLTQTLMIHMSVDATTAEVDLLLVSLRDRIDSYLSSFSDIAAAVGLLDRLFKSVTAARLVCDDDSDFVTAEVAHSTDSNVVSDDEGLLTKRQGASLMFSQIYD